MKKRINSLRDLFSKLPSDGEVRHLLRNFNFGMGGRGRVPSAKELAESMGFEVYLVEMAPSQRGRLVADAFSQNGYAIEINKNDDVVVKRWTLLHEVMHFFLHRSDDPFAPQLNRAGGSHFYDLHEKQQEREANEAVEALIFGDGALAAAITLHGENEAALAKHFGVSVKALQIALKNF
jgi:Zn-dependent peptidase ImmA (M78 family)